MHGITRLWAGASIFAQHLVQQLTHSPLPEILIRSFGYALPWLEAGIGILILLGLATRPALIAGASLMVVLTFGSSFLQDWNVMGLQLIYAVVYFLLLIFIPNNHWSVDTLLTQRRS
ncbi:MAG: MauE/DoxX family redox-associated membrane protein [Acidobacteriaceae bacterium]